MSILPLRRRPAVEPATPLPPDPSTEERLMALVAQGDAAAFDDLVRRHWGPLCAYAGRILNDRDAGKDVAQTTFVRVWQRRADWRGGSVRNYLLLLARNLCFDEFRHTAVRARHSDQTREAFSSPVPTPGDRLDVREVQAAIEVAVQELPPRRREAFILVHIRGLSYQEAAHVMGVARATVSNQIVSALEQLRTKLGGLL